MVLPSLRVYVRETKCRVAVCPGPGTPCVQPLLLQAWLSIEECDLDVYVWPCSTRGQFCSWPCVSQGSPENQNEQDGCVYKEKFILRNWLVQFMEITSPKSAGRASRPETQGGVALSPKAVC